MAKQRKLQHIAWMHEIQDAKKSGAKVTAQCGALVYPMTEMDPSIPTCTPCSRKTLVELKKALQGGIYAWRFTNGDGSGSNSFGGAA